MILWVGLKLVNYCILQCFFKKVENWVHLDFQIYDTVAKSSEYLTHHIELDDEFDIMSQTWTAADEFIDKLIEDTNFQYPF